MIRLSFYRGVLAAALSAATSVSATFTSNSSSSNNHDYDDTAFLLSQADSNVSADTDASNMSSILSSIGAYSLADA